MRAAVYLTRHREWSRSVHQTCIALVTGAVAKDPIHQTDDKRGTGVMKPLILTVDILESSAADMQGTSVYGGLSTNKRHPILLILASRSSLVTFCPVLHPAFNVLLMQEHPSEEDR